MDNFDKIIKNKLENFEVPFNEAHWAEMDAKLNKVKATKLTKAISVAAAVVAIITISAFLITEFSSEQIDATVTQIKNQQNENQTTEKTAITEKKPTSTTHKITPSNKANVTKNEQAEETATNTLEEITEQTDPVENDELKTQTNTEKQNTTEEAETIKIRFEALNSIVCQEQIVYFKSYAEGYNLVYDWNFGDGTSSNEAHPKHLYKADGIYDVTLSVTDQKTKKTYTDKQNNVITILPIPKKDFNYTEQSLINDRNKIKYPYVTLSVDVKNSKAFVWDAGNGKISTKAAPEFLFEKAGTYPVKATFTHQSGCEVTFIKEIEVEQDFDLLAATGIEPNHTNKERATFLPKALYTWDIKFEIVISDKLGNEVYSTTDSKQPWNGKLNNVGEVLPDGVYVWKATTFDVKGVAHNHNGTVKLITN